MSTTIADVAVALHASPAAFLAEAQAAGVEGGKAAGTGFASGFALLAGAAVVGAVVAITEKTAAWGNAVWLLQQKTGLSAQTITEWQFAAQKMGLTGDEMGTMLSRMATNAAKTNGPFEKMGIDVRDASGALLPMDTLLRAASDHFAGMTNPTQRAADAVALFGKGGAVLLPFLNQGSQGLAALGEEAKRLGVVLTDQNVVAFHNFTVAQAQLGEGLKGLGVSLSEAVVPILLGLVNAANAAAPALRFVGDNIGAFMPILDILAVSLTTRVVTGLGQAALGAIGFGSASVVAAGEVGASSAAEVTSVGLVAGAFDAMKASALAAWIASLGPVALAAGAAAAFMLLFDNITHTADAEVTAAQAAGNLTGAQAALKAQVDAGSISQDDYDAKLKNVKDQQYLQADAAAIATGATNAQADAAGKAAVANDQGTATLATNTGALGANADATDNLSTSANGLSTTTSEAAQWSAYMATITSGSLTPALTGATTGFINAATEGSILASTERDVAKAASDSTGPLSAEAAALDLVAFKAAIAAQNLAAVHNSTTAKRVTAATNRNLRAAGETGGPAALSADNYGNPISIDYTPFPPDFVPPAGPKASTAAANALVNVIKVDLTSAAQVAKTAVDALFDGMHQKALVEIQDDKNAAYAIAEKTANRQRDALTAAKAALFAPVDAEQASLNAELAAQQRASLVAQRIAAVQALAANTNPTQAASLIAQVRQATQALADFDKQAKINADQAAAQAASDKLDAANAAIDPLTGAHTTVIDLTLAGAKAKADAAAATATTAENAKAARDKKAFDDTFSRLEKELQATKNPAARQKILDEIQALYDKSGLTAADKAKASGRLIAIALADGMKAEVKAVEQGAESLVAAINKYIRTKSPSEQGPWSVEPPEKLGRNAARQFAAGMHAEAATYGGLFSGAYALDGMARGVGGAASAGAAAAITAGDAVHPVTVYLGEVFERIFGGPRLIEFVDHGLTRKYRK